MLRAGQFALTTELAPPDSADPQEVYQRARVFDGYVDAINATDGSGANCHMSSLAVCALLTRVGYAPVMQISCRDNNRIAIQGDILGGAAMGVCNLLCLSGDGVQAGDHPQAKPVFDLDSISLLETARTLRDEHRFLSGRKITFAPRVFLGAAENPFRPSVGLARPAAGEEGRRRRAVHPDTVLLRRAAAAAISCAQVEDLGLLGKVFILVGVGPLRSAKAANGCARTCPACTSRTRHQAHGRRDRRAREGRNLCIELMQELRFLPA